MFRSVRQFRPLAVALGLIALAACQTAPEHKTFPEIGFSHQAPITLHVNQVDVQRLDQPSLDPPHIELRMPQSPGEVAGRWAQHRLQAGGGNARALFRVLEASVTETPLEQTKGVKGYFTNDQSERYDASIKVELLILGDGGSRLGRVEAASALSQTIAEDATLADREELWFSMTETLMRNLDKELEKNIRNILARHVMPAG